MPLVIFGKTLTLNNCNVTFTKDFIDFLNNNFNFNKITYFLNSNLISKITNFDKIFIFTYIFIYLLIIFNNFSIFNIFKFTEKELNSINDSFFEISLILTIYIYIIYSYYSIAINYNYFFNFILLFKSLSIIILFNILFFIYNCGFFFLIFLRGSNGKQIFLYEFIYDLINLVSFSLRLSIQMSRIFIIGVLFYTFFHSLDSFLLDFFNLNFKINASYSKELISVFYLLVEYIHTFLLFIVQLCTFMVMLFWLFQFLFTSFPSINLENSHIK